MFNLNSTLNFGISPVLVFQLEVYYKADRLLTGLTAQQKGTIARWYSNKTSLIIFGHLQEWRTIFNLFDVDGDQTITHEELGIVLRFLTMFLETFCQLIN